MTEVLRAHLHGLHVLQADAEALQVNGFTLHNRVEDVAVHDDPLGLGGHGLPRDAGVGGGEGGEGGVPALLPLVPTPQRLLLAPRRQAPLLRGSCWERGAESSPKREVYRNYPN